MTKTVDPFAGSYVVESLTDEVEAEARKLMEQVEELGGAVAAIEKGFQKNEIEKSAYQIAREIDTGERVVVGVNRFRLDEEEPYEPLRVDPAIEAQQAERLAKLRAERDNAAVEKHLAALKKAAEGADNVLFPMKEALRARATVGEVCNALREVWGVYVAAGRLLSRRAPRRGSLRPLPWGQCRPLITPESARPSTHSSPSSSSCAATCMPTPSSPGRRSAPPRSVADRLAGAGIDVQLLPKSGLIAEVGTAGRAARRAPRRPRRAAGRRPDDRPVDQHGRRASRTPAGTTCTPRRSSAPVWPWPSCTGSAPLPGRVRLLFQPAEEVMPGGALELIAGGALDGRRARLRAALRPGHRRRPGRPARGADDRRRRRAHTSGSPAAAATPRARTSPRTSPTRSASSSPSCPARCRAGSTRGPAPAWSGAWSARARPRT